jgi:hypothetical protein
MSYLTIVRMVQSGVLTQRCVAAAAQEVAAGVDPVSWVGANTWLLCAQPGWSDAWDYADVTAGHVGDWGADESVITDGMILSAVQALIGGTP